MRTDTSERTSVSASSHEASNQVRDAQAVGFSPAPWKVDEPHGWVISAPRWAKENVVAHIGPMLEREKANARLISSAPDLLELVSDLYGELMCRVNGQDAPQEACDCWVCEWANRAFDALRKAGVR
jgi:hypothetical protein